MTVKIKIRKRKTFTVVYFETVRLSREVKAETVEEAIAASEKLRADGNWDGCEETTLGTNGVEEVWNAKGKQVYSSTPEGLDDHA